MHSQAPLAALSRVLDPPLKTYPQEWMWLVSLTERSRRYSKSKQASFVSSMQRKDGNSRPIQQSSLWIARTFSLFPSSRDSSSVLDPSSSSLFPTLSHHCTVLKKELTCRLTSISVSIYFVTRTGLYKRLMDLPQTFVL